MIILGIFSLDSVIEQKIYVMEVKKSEEKTSKWTW